MNPGGTSTFWLQPDPQAGRLLGDAPRHPDASGASEPSELSRIPKYDVAHLPVLQDNVAFPPQSHCCCLKTCCRRTSRARDPPGLRSAYRTWGCLQEELWVDFCPTKRHVEVKFLVPVNLALFRNRCSMLK